MGEGINIKDRKSQLGKWPVYLYVITFGFLGVVFALEGNTAAAILTCIVLASIYSEESSRRLIDAQNTYIKTLRRLEKQSLDELKQTIERLR